MPPILVTGFEPFGGLPHNPSAAVLSLLPKKVSGVEIKTEVLPVATQAVGPILKDLHAEGYLAIIHTGVAEDRAIITVEREATNRLDFRIPDNCGQFRSGIPVVADGPDVYPARLPLKRIVSAWDRAGLPGAISESAGHYLCNQVMYTSLHHLPQATPTGFVHLPPDETLANMGPHQPLHTQAEAIGWVLQVVKESL